MFPDACGDEFERAIAAGANPKTVVPDDYVVVKGGTASLPASGDLFSGAVGPTLSEAAAAVPHGQIRVTTAGAIRAAGEKSFGRPNCLAITPSTTNTLT